jgi:flagellar biosynthesis component FlhA
MSTTALAAGSMPGGSILQRLREYVLPLVAISVIFVMLVTLPAFALDFLLSMSMAASIIVFLSAVQIRRAVELSVFPTLLLLLTLFRLALNIASSRRILLHGQEGTAAAGKVIEAFGQFVVGGNYVVGFVLFLALIAIQFLVVSHGAVRTAEVTARFTLDALPGKQMAIDADMNAGLIDEAEARRRRQAIAREAEFYGAMDGAARFNQRDSLATILITGINIIAGLLIGTLQQGIELSEAARTYTVLTVGDGLVTLIPSLLVSVAGGITLTRANSAGLLGGEIRQQLLAKPVTLYVASLVCGAMCLIPGLPKLAFLTVSAFLFFAGRRCGGPAGRAGGGGEKEGGRGAKLRSRATAAPGRADARNRISTDSAGGREAGRATVEPRACSAAPSLRGDGISGASGAYQRQSAPQTARVFVQLARDGNWPLADRGTAVAGRLRRAEPPPPGREGDAGAGFRRARDLDCAGSGRPGQRRRLLGCGRGHGDYHASGRTHPPQRLGTAGTGRDQAADGLAQ